MKPRLSGEFLEGLLPSREQSLVITAALGDDAAALTAYRDWRSTLDLTAHFDHQVFRLLPLMYDRLRRLGVQDDLTGRLKGTYRQAWARNHRLLDEMRPVLAALQAAGIRTLLLKGAPLALAYYGNVALRPMDDVDLAVRRNDLPRALQVLGEFGFLAPRVLTPSELRHQHSIALFTPERRQIDLHWDVMVECPGEAGENLFWQGTEALDFLGVRTETLAPTLMLFHTVVHGMRWNLEPPVRWIPDATMLLRRRQAEVDWHQLVEVAKAFRLTDRVGLGLGHLRQTVAQDLPREPLEALRAAPLDWLQRLERTTVLRDFYLTYRTPLGPVRLASSAAGRRMHGTPPWLAPWFFADFLRFHWGQGRWSRLLGLMTWGFYTRTLRDPARRVQARWARGS